MRGGRPQVILSALNVAVATHIWLDAGWSWGVWLNYGIGAIVLWSGCSNHSLACDRED